MACLDENQLIAFFSPGRSPAVTAEVEAHTSDCKACRELLAQYAKLSAERGTAQTRQNDSMKISSAAAPSLTPGGGADLAQPPASAFAAKLIGTVLKGKWQIERLLGVGGMAYVFAARHRNGRRVAIKCMRPELAVEPAFVERFLREGYVANKIEHPGAVAILDDDVMDDGTPFLVMELLSGRSLRDHLVERTLTLHEALKATADVLDVLAAAHEKGIVHRDLKPDNLFLTESGTVKVLDFGIARLKERTRSEHATHAGTTMGTVGFMPPEQARGLTNEVDARSDVWAVGATLYSLLTGRAVHEARTTNEALLLAMTTPVRPMAQVLPSLPAEVGSVLDRALAFERASRFPSAKAMKTALDAASAALGNTIVELEPAAPAQPAQLTELMPSQPSGALLARAFARRGSSSSIDPPIVTRRQRARLVVGLVVGAAALLLVVAFVGSDSGGGRAAPPGSSGLVAAPPVDIAPPPHVLDEPPTTAPPASATAAVPEGVPSVTKSSAPARPTTHLTTSSTSPPRATATTAPTTQRVSSTPAVPKNPAATSISAPPPSPAKEGRDPLGVRR